MTREELHALVDAQYDQFQALQQQPTFLAYEQQFAHIWTALGKDILQAAVGQAPENPRKKHLPNPVWQDNHRSQPPI